MEWPFGYLPVTALLVALLWGLAFYPWEFDMMNKPELFKVSTYDNSGHVFIKEGYYTRGELEALILQLEAANKMANKEEPNEQR